MQLNHLFCKLDIVQAGGFVVSLGDIRTAPACALQVETGKCHYDLGWGEGSTQQPDDYILVDNVKAI